MKRILTFLLMMVAFYSSKAQWVSIPDSNFGKWLTNSYPSCMQGNPKIGFQMDTSCGTILSATSVICSSLQIENLEGIQYFKNLTYLDCNSNRLNLLPDLPDSLNSLLCSQNLIISLPNLPTSLRAFDCSSNRLWSIPTLPTSLLTLDCSYNSLSSNFSLPVSLRELNCRNNRFNYIPALPVSLRILICAFNNLTTLPSLPASLINLDFNNNQIDTIQILPDSLQVLVCSNNKLTALPILPNTLESIICGTNQINNIPTLPVNLNNLDCSYNKIKALPYLPSKLSALNCSLNLISFLPNLPDSLHSLICSLNFLSFLPNLPNSLRNLDCNYNWLTSLPTLPNSLMTLTCRHNRLTSFSDFPSNLNYLDCAYNPNLSCLPKLEFISYIDIEETAIKCISNIPKVNINYGPSVNSLPLCNLNSGCLPYWNISGNVHKDTSNTCLQDSLYPGKRLHGFKTILSQGGIVKEQMYITSTGEYSFDTDSFTTYQVSIDTIGLPIQVKCPVSGIQSLDITANDSIKGNVNFGLECKGYDIGVNTITGRFRAGNLSLVNILIGDLLDFGCTSNSSAIVTTTISGAAKYVSPAVGALTPTKVAGNTITYNIADVSTIKADTDFNIMVQTNVNAELGSSICITTTIHTLTPDYIPSNDSLTICFPVVNSFDPNEKTVYPKNISQDATWLNYTIQFQNTGNDTAYDIVIRDTLSTNLDIETFQYLASSHSPIVQVKGREAIFTFANINLLDSFHNEPQSHGWLQYRIKTKANLPLQSQIKNTAYIYFDFNSPVVTNTTLNTVDVTGISDIQKAEPFLALYPNPANSVLNISTNSLHPKSLTIYDASGRKVSEQAFTTSLDISGLSQGIYLLEVKSEEGITRRRFVRQ